MEHRYGIRKEIRLKIRFLRNEKVIATGYTRNISADGFFLLTDYRPVTGHECIEFEVSDCNDPNLKHNRHKAMVMHTCSDGLGIMIEERVFETILSKHSDINRQIDLEMLKAS